MNLAVVPAAARQVGPAGRDAVVFKKLDAILVGGAAVRVDARVADDPDVDLLALGLHLVALGDEHRSHRAGHHEGGDVDELLRILDGGQHQRFALDGHIGDGHRGGAFDLAFGRGDVGQASQVLRRAGRAQSPVHQGQEVLLALRVERNLLTGGQFLSICARLRSV